MIDRMITKFEILNEERVLMWDSINEFRVYLFDIINLILKGNSNKISYKK